jgi:hypothetical protein
LTDAQTGIVNHTPEVCPWVSSLNQLILEALVEINVVMDGEFCPPADDMASGVSPKDNKGTELKSDPYTISEDGHVVGHDGFIVPKDFEEFKTRFPNHVKNYVRAHWISPSYDDREDRVHDLEIHLMYIPPESIYRQPGYNGRPEGCTDRIQLFQPDEAYGASEKRFFYWVNYCLRNVNTNSGKKSLSNPVSRPTTISLGSVDSSGEIIDEEYVMARVNKDRFYDFNNHKPVEEQCIVNEFLDFVEKHNPELISVIDTIGQATSFVDAQRMLGMTEKLFLRARARIATLYRCYRSGETPQKQRRVYKSHKDVKVDVTKMKVFGLGALANRGIQLPERYQYACGMTTTF